MFKILIYNMKNIFLNLYVELKKSMNNHLVNNIEFVNTVSTKYDQNVYINRPWFSKFG